MEAVNVLFVAIALLILLAATSVRCDADSREGSLTKESDPARRGII
jgi:hypothetical protein